MPCAANVRTYMERYRSGHNGADSKSVCAKAHVGTNPTLSAMKASDVNASLAFCVLKQLAGPVVRKSLDGEKDDINLPLPKYIAV